MDKFEETRLTGLVWNVIGEIGRFATALYGISKVLQENPEIDKVIYAGIGFGIASTIKYMSDAYITTPEYRDLKNQISGIEKKLNK